MSPNFNGVLVNRLIPYRKQYKFKKLIGSVSIDWWISAFSIKQTFKQLNLDRWSSLITSHQAVVRIRKT